MKTTITTEEPTFKPITVSFTMETLSELRDFLAVTSIFSQSGNYPDKCSVMLDKRIDISGNQAAAIMDDIVPPAVWCELLNMYNQYMRLE